MIGPPLATEVPVINIDVVKRQYLEQLVARIHAVYNGWMMLKGTEEQLRAELENNEELVTLKQRLAYFEVRLRQLPGEIRDRGPRRRIRRALKAEQSRLRHIQAADKAKINELEAPLKEELDSVVNLKSNQYLVLHDLLGDLSKIDPLLHAALKGLYKTA